MVLHRSVVQPPLPAATITGLDIIALVLLLHVWVLVAGLATWQDDARTGVEWVDRRVHMSPRLYGALMLLAVLVVWLPFAVGQFPIGGDGVLRRRRSVLFVFTAGGLLVGAGFYFLGGVLTNLRLFLTVSRTEPVDAATVDAGRVLVSGRIEALTEPLEAPISDAESVCYQLSGTRTTFQESSTFDPLASGGRSTDSTQTTGSSQRRSSDPIASLAEGSEQLTDRRRPFALRDDSGRVVVDPTDAQLRLERSASAAVPGDEPTPRGIVSALRETSGLERTDRDWVYHEATLEPGEAVTVVGVADVDAESPSIPNETADLPVITAGKTASEFVLTPGCEHQMGCHVRRTICGCAIAGVGLIGGGSWILWTLAGHL
ncbi:hypothetical protein D8Y22_18675 [Salinadaptatus halalkaliphilus]|uniref:RING-type E3 ubiquitin transferase n=1 Tax=Salinadaptatus halalkaliphilus TaxID=2419781 RepID=A0A4S3TL56_9EURY|nr:GIDE domain-containing protein [Salinadaptatus halalkaliphilus]THE63328.1 hypothetical protein D8Y22_18675 [Salinadaptatus halalkaliphilus]